MDNDYDQLAQNQLVEEEIEKLYSLPEKKRIQIKNFNFELNHGSPWNQNAYLYPDTDPQIFEKANHSEIDFVLVDDLYHIYLLFDAFLLLR